MDLSRPPASLGVQTRFAREDAMRRIGLIAAIVASIVVVPGSPAFAEERVCRGTIGARTVDNLRVPQGATCTLNGTFVKGTIRVQRAATLMAIDVRVIGNVQGQNAENVVVRATSRVGGSVQVVQGERARVANSRVDGDILFDENDGRLSVVSSRIDEDVQAFQNTGGVRIRDNRIDGNLQCKQNSPPPTGGGNVVQGNKEDQCKGL
jgi:hypothetical protein